MKNLFILSFLALTSCDLGTRNETKEINSFNSEEFTVFGHQVLTSDLNIEARKVIFAPGTTIKSGAYSISISADEVQFNDAQILSYDITEIGECYQDGKPSGSVLINSNKISGSPIFKLYGQKAGKNGWGYSIHHNKNEFYHYADKPVKNERHLVLNDCRKEAPAPFEDKSYWSSKITNAGNFGYLKINASAEVENFRPEISSHVSQGDFQFLIRAPGERLVSRGQNKGPMQVCFFDYKGFETCGEDYLMLSIKVTSPTCINGECNSI